MEAYKQWRKELKALNDIIQSLTVWDEHADTLQREYDYLLNQRPEIDKSKVHVGSIYTHKDGGLYVANEIKTLNGDWYSTEVVVYTPYNSGQTPIYVRTLEHFLSSFEYFREDD